MASQNLSVALEDSGACSRLGKKNERPRRSWTQSEEELLIASLKELITQGWKSDNGFRAGYLGKLEEALKKSFPGTDLKGNPHINSKLCAWKKSYYSLSSILNRSGVGINENHQIVCEDDAWDQIVKLDPKARLMRFKSWPYYSSWQEIFGKDRANGEAAEDIPDAYHAMRNDDMDSAGGKSANFEFNLDDISEKEGEGDSAAQSQKSAHVAKPKRKKRKASDDMNVISDIISEIGNKTDARLANLALRVGYEFDLGKSKNEVFNQLGVIPWLSLDQRFNCCEILSKDVFKLEVFRGLPDDAIPYYVERLLKMKEA